VVANRAAPTVAAGEGWKRTVDDSFTTDSIDHSHPLGKPDLPMLHQPG
jgi:hypothetical protein